MGRNFSFSTIICGSVLLACGCGSNIEPVPSAQASAATASETSTTGKDSAKPVTDSAATKVTEPTANDAGPVKPEQSPVEAQASSATAAQTPTQPTVKPAVAAPTKRVAEPTTTVAALAVLDLEAFPVPNLKQVFERNPTSISYTTQATLSSANTAIMSELAKVGWKEAKHLVTSTDQYVDRLLEKNGYYLRLTISTGGGSDEVVVNMWSLGNFDLRGLPQTQDAEPQESTPVMAGHRSSLSIGAAYDDLSKRMIEGGWQIVEEYQATMPVVPHYRSVHFRKNAMRVHLGLVSDPAKPTEKLNIFYHAESVMPMDVPTLDSKQAIKYDSTENRALVPFQLDRSAMVELLAKNAQNFAWQLVGAEEFTKEKASVMYLDVGKSTGVAARLVETKGTYWISMNRAKLPTAQDAKSVTSQAENVAQSETAADSPAAKKMKAEIEAEIATTGNAIEKSIHDEINKALGSLSGSGTKPDMQALQAQAARLQAQLGQANEDEPETTTAKKSANAVVPDDAEPIREEDRAISTTQARIKVGSREIVLKNCLAYAVMEDDMPTKILFFSDKPLRADKLDELRDSGKRFIVSDGFGESYPDVTLELRLTDTSSVLSFSGDGIGISTNSSDIRSTLRLKRGKLQGRVSLEKPVEIRNGTITFEVTVSQDVRQ